MTHIKTLKRHLSPGEREKKNALSRKKTLNSLHPYFLGEGAFKFTLSIQLTQSLPASPSDHVPNPKVAIFPINMRGYGIVTVQATWMITPGHQGHIVTSVIICNPRVPVFELRGGPPAHRKLKQNHETPRTKASLLRHGHHPKTKNKYQRGSAPNPQIAENPGTRAAWPG